MALLHNTTMAPTKLELLTGWLPLQSWYLGDGSPLLARAGGFRLDDPAGAVGIEFMIVRDDGGAEPVFYLVPMTYRGEPRPEGRTALIGTSEHGVLGKRWIYDGVQDPVLQAQLAALVRGTVVAQAQTESHTTDPTVEVSVSTSAAPTLRRVLRAGDEPGDGSISVTWKTEDGEVQRGVITE